MSELEVLDEHVIPRGNFGPTARLLTTEGGVSQNFHRRFESVASYVTELGGDKSLVIEKVLIANNGVAAVKAIRSIRRWAYEVFGNERAISFVVMATPEDLRYVYFLAGAHVCAIALPSEPCLFCQLYQS
jgi:Biotin carboxylase, N-terminal domain